MDLRRQRRPGSSGAAAEPPRVVPPTPAVLLRSDSTASCSIPRPRGERQAAAGREGLGGRQERHRLRGLSRCHNRFENSFSPAITTNSCSSMNVAYLDDIKFDILQVFSTSMGMGFPWFSHLRFPSSKFP